MLGPEGNTSNGAGSPFAPTAGISNGSSILSWLSRSATPGASSLTVSTIRANSWGNWVPMLHTCSLSYNSPSDPSMFRGHNYTKSQFRFLAWVAYDRKSFPGIDEAQQRTCSLIGCERVFNREDAMLQHVEQCWELSKGLYRCSKCQKEEQIGRYHTKRCPDELRQPRG